MKNFVLAFLSASAVLFYFDVHASESVVKESKPVGTVPLISKE